MIRDKLREIDRYMVREWVVRWVMFLVIIAIPLAIRIRINEITGSVAMLYGGFFNQADIFHKFKSELLHMAGSVAVIVMIFNYKRFIRMGKSYTAKLIFLFMFFIIASTIASQYFDVALFGVIERFEGAFSYMSYLMLFFFAFFLIDKEQHDWVYAFVFISALVMAIVGLSQYFKHDIFATTWFQYLITPSEFKSIGGQMSINSSLNTVYGTLYNPNYMGSYYALIIPMLVSGILYFKNYLVKIGFVSLVLVSLLLLLASHSSAGIVGILGVIGVFLLIMISKLNKKIIIGILGFVLMFSAITWGEMQRFTSDIIRSFIAKENIVVENLQIIDDELFVTMNELGKDFSVKYDDLHYKVKLYNADHQLMKLDKVENTGEYYPLNEEYQFITINSNLAGMTLSFYPLREVEIENGMKEMQIRDIVKERPIDKEVVDENEVLIHLADVKLAKTNRRVISVKSDGNLTMYTFGQNYRESLVPADSLFFEGYEHAGSGRGYIWSRSIPLIEDYLVIGAGPDVYAYIFPQEDLIGKMNYMSNAYGLVDKPHNTYLQIAINTGFASLIVFLSALGLFLVTSIKFIKGRDNMLLAGIFYSVIAFALTSFFNDSVVSIAPIFWLFLGFGANLLINDRNL
ncbi:MAG: O-antigen ligase family protein [Bacillota bacterium]|nr:O-antigen ligase family protein [Bacillota bacterium]